MTSWDIYRSVPLTLFILLIIIKVNVFCVQPLWTSPLRHKLVPDVIESVPTDIEKIYIRYESRISVDLGNKLDISQVKNQPLRVQYHGALRRRFTLLMVDPDGTKNISNNTGDVILHWLIGNIPGSDVRRGDIVANYVSPILDKDSDPHRFVFLIYRQRGIRRVKFEDAFTVNDVGARRLNIFDFVRRFSLHGPIAANFFLAKRDEQ